MSSPIQAQTSMSIVRNVAFGSLTWFLPLGLSFVATPMIVRSLGNNDYGIYALVLGFIGYSFTFNLGRPIIRYVAEYRNSGQSEKIRNIISASFFLNLAVGAIGVLIICSLAGWLVREVFRIDPSEQTKAIQSLYLASSIIFMSMLNQVFSSVILGLQRFDVYSKIFTVNGLLLIGGNIVLTYLGFGLLALFWWNLGVLSLFSIFFAITAKKLLPEFGIRLRFGREALQLVLRHSAGTIGYQVLANVLLLFERGWIAHRLGTEALTYYVVPMSLAMQLQAFISSLVMVIFPLASELKNEPEKLLRLYTKSTKVVSLLVVFVIACVLVQGKSFLTLWMGADFAEHTSTLFILQVGCFGLLAIMSIAWQTTEGLGFPHFNAIATGVSTTVGIILMIIFTNSYGIVGIGAARFIAFATIFSFVFYVERKFFRKVQIRFWLGLAGSLLLASAFASATELLVNSILQLGWITLIASVGLGALVYAGILWALGFVTSDEKILLRSILGR